MEYNKSLPSCCMRTDLQSCAGSPSVATLPPSLAVVCCVVVMALLAGCSNDDFSDLTRYLSEVKARSKEPIKPLPEIKVIEPFMFKPDGLRDPFKPLEQPDRLRV